VVVSILGALALAGLAMSVFANGTGRQGTTGGSARSTPPSQTVPASARQSCSDFDQATGRLAVKDNKGFIDAMTNGSSAAQQAATTDGQWQSLVLGFASFAADLAANDSQKVFNDLNTINQICGSVRGPQPLNLKGP
jgi:hypothetical protein